VNAALAYSLGTLFVWSGYAGAARALYLGCLARWAPLGHEPRTMRDGLLLTLLASGGLLMVGSYLSGPTPSLLQPPLVWFVLPAEGWLFVAALLVMGRSFCRLAVSLPGAERRTEAAWAVGTSAITLASWLLYRRAGFDVDVLRGHLSLSPSAAISLLLIAAAAVAAMVAGSSPGGRERSASTFLSRLATEAGHSGHRTRRSARFRAKCRWQRRATGARCSSWGLQRAAKGSSR
jgi:hypothetical protein